MKALIVFTLITLVSCTDSEGIVDSTPSESSSSNKISLKDTPNPDTIYVPIDSELERVETECEAGRVLNWESIVIDTAENKSIRHYETFYVIGERCFYNILNEGYVIAFDTAYSFDHYMWVTSTDYYGGAVHGWSEDENERDTLIFSSEDHLLRLYGSEEWIEEFIDPDNFH